MGPVSSESIINIQVGSGVLIHHNTQARTAGEIVELERKYAGPAVTVGSAIHKYYGIEKAYEQ